MNATDATFAPVSLNDAVAAAEAVRADLGASFLDREIEIDVLLTALVAGEHVLLLGPPGTGKSAIAGAFAKAIGGTLFQKLFTKFTTDQEVFGPVALSGLREDRFRRVTTGYLPEADVAFLDECFKANSAILNALLTALNEREFDNDGQRGRIPLKIAVGASNELPEDEGLAALYDRFVLRRWVSYLKDDAQIERLLLMGGEPTTTATISEAEVACLRAHRDAVDIRPLVSFLLELFRKLSTDHGIEVSDRRKRKLVKLIRSRAALAGDSVATKRHAKIALEALWDEPAQRAQVADTFREIAGPDDEDLAIQLMDAAREAMAVVDMKASGAAFTRPAGEALTRLDEIASHLRDLTPSEYSAKILERVTGFRQVIAREMASRF